MDRLAQRVVGRRRTDLGGLISRRCQPERSVRHGGKRLGWVADLYDPAYYEDATKKIPKARPWVPSKWPEVAPGTFHKPWFSLGLGKDSFLPIGPEASWLALGAPRTSLQPNR